MRYRSINEVCDRQTSDGGYLLAGDTNSVEYGGLLPWLAKVDGSGALVWQQAE